MEIIISLYLTENAGTLSSAINSGSLYNELDLWYLGLGHIIFPLSESFIGILKYVIKRPKHMFEILLNPTDFGPSLGQRY